MAETKIMVTNLIMVISEAEKIDLHEEDYAMAITHSAVTKVNKVKETVQT